MHEMVAAPLVTSGDFYLIVGGASRRVRRHPECRPGFEDWLWHVIVPMLACGTLLAAGLFVEWNSAGALFAIGPVALLLLFAGIHNAWDAAAFLMTQGEPGTRESGTGGGAAPVPGPAVVTEGPPAAPMPQPGSVSGG